MSQLSPHLQRLEDESIYILREVAAEFRRPVMLYSVGKDSSVMLHLARKAFFPARPPFPFLHIAPAGTSASCWCSIATAWPPSTDSTCWCTATRRRRSAGVNPFDTETGEYSRLMLTEALKAGARPPRLRCRDRRRPARRGEVARQGAHLLAPQRRPCLGSAQPAAGAVAAVQRAAGARRHDARLPAVELDRARCLEPTSRPRRFPIVPLYLAAERPVVRARRHAADASTTSACASSRRRRRRSAASASARWAAGR